MKKVLIAVDETDGSIDVLSVFQNMVRPPETVILVHVRRPEAGYFVTEQKTSSDRKPENILNFYRKQLEDGGLVSVKTVVREGMPTDEILKVAREEGVDLIIAGHNGMTIMQGLYSGAAGRNTDTMKSSDDGKHNWRTTEGLKVRAAR